MLESYERKLIRGAISKIEDMLVVLNEKQFNFDAADEAARVENEAMIEELKEAQEELESLL